MSKRGILVLMPEGKSPAITPGSVVITADCGHRAWISPSGLQGQLSLGLRTVCERCVPHGPKAVAELPGSREELAELLGAERAERLVAEVTEYVRKGGRL